MGKTSITLAVSVVLALVGLTQTGCTTIAAGGAGGGTVAYLKGDVETVLDASLPASATAVRSAISDLRFTAVNESEDALYARFVARTAADKKVVVKLEQKTLQATAISIRVGVFGDQSISQTILDSIQARL